MSIKSELFFWTWKHFQPLENKNLMFVCSRDSHLSVQLHDELIVTIWARPPVCFNCNSTCLFLLRIIKVLVSNVSPHVSSITPGNHGNVSSHLRSGQSGRSVEPIRRADSGRRDEFHACPACNQGNGDWTLTADWFSLLAAVSGGEADRKWPNTLALLRSSNGSVTNFIWRSKVTTEILT